VVQSHMGRKIRGWMHPPDSASLFLLRIIKCAQGKRGMMRAASMAVQGKDNPLGENVTVRFSKRIRDLIKQVAQARGMDESDVIREAVHQKLASLSFLSDDEKKALGVLEH